MSNNVGSLTLRQFEQNGVSFLGYGHLSMLGTSFKFAVTEFVSNNPDAPTMVAHAKTGDGRLVEIGKAWRKIIKKGDMEGKDFFSFTFDDPTFSQPLNVTSFPTREAGVYDIVWQRPKQAKPLQMQTEAPLIDDEIPF